MNCCWGFVLWIVLFPSVHTVHACAYALGLSSDVEICFFLNRVVFGYLYRLLSLTAPACAGSWSAQKTPILKRKDPDEFTKNPEKNIEIPEKIKDPKQAIPEKNTTPNKAIPPQHLIEEGYIYSA